ncbi:ABC transporter permease subunit [soil metagenome]
MSQPESQPESRPEARPEARFESGARLVTPPFRSVSPGRIWALASSTFTQLVRMKVFYFLFIFSAAVIGAAMLFLDWSFEQELKLLKDVSLGAMALFSGIFAIVGTALLIPKDIDDRTLYTILSKPVPRFEYLLGKLLGVLILIAVSLVFMQVFFSVVLYLRQGQILDQELARIRAAPPMGTAPEDIPGLLEETRQVIAAQGLNANLLNATLAIFLKACVMASVALLLSTFASSTLFTIISALAIYIIGHFQGLARDYFLAGDAEGAARVLAVLVAIIFPDFKAFDIVDDVVSGQIIPARIMLEMAGFAAFYFIVYNLAAWFVFSDKEL